MQADAGYLCTEWKQLPLLPNFFLCKQEQQVSCSFFGEDPFTVLSFRASWSIQSTPRPRMALISIAVPCQSPPHLWLVLSSEPPLQDHLGHWPPQYLLAEWQSGTDQEIRVSAPGTPEMTVSSHLSSPPPVYPKTDLHFKKYLLE